MAERSKAPASGAGLFVGAGSNPAGVTATFIDEWNKCRSLFTQI